MSDIERGLAYTFTGQGSQRVCMGRDDFRAAAMAQIIFNQADQQLGFSLSTLCKEGPIEELTLTSNAQPAIVVHSLAAYAATIESHGRDFPTPDIVLGHSVGEFSALAAAGVMDMFPHTTHIEAMALFVRR